MQCKCNNFIVFLLVCVIFTVGYLVYKNGKRSNSLSERANLNLNEDE